jgi:hypothetical protein
MNSKTYRNTLGVVLGLVLAVLPSVAADIPGASSTEKPALTLFDGDIIAAWSGPAAAGAGPGYPVFTSKFNGVWSTPVQVRALTTTAPALAAGDGTAYLATTPPDSNDGIAIAVSSGGAFVPTETLCDSTGCAQTAATPALAGDGTTLYAAWTTAEGTIMYAVRSNDVWRIASQPVPHALTFPTAGPALKVFGNALYVAWVTPSGKYIEIESATLPLSDSSWSATQRVSAETAVAPAFGIYAQLDGDVIAQSLYLVWTTPAKNLSFALRSAATGDFLPWNSPFPIPHGSLTTLSPATSSGEVLLTDSECRLIDTVAVTADGTSGGGSAGSPIEPLSITKPCPP